MYHDRTEEVGTVREAIEILEEVAEEHGDDTKIRELKAAYEGDRVSKWHSSPAWFKIHDDGTVDIGL